MNCGKDLGHSVVEVEGKENHVLSHSYNAHV